MGIYVFIVTIIIIIVMWKILAKAFFFQSNKGAGWGCFRETSFWESQGPLVRQRLQLRTLDFYYGEMTLTPDLKKMMERHWDGQLLLLLISSFFFLFVSAACGLCTTTPFQVSSPHPPPFFFLCSLSFSAHDCSRFQPSSTFSLSSLYSLFVSHSSLLLFPTLWLSVSVSGSGAEHKTITLLSIELQKFQINLAPTFLFLLPA